MFLFMQLIILFCSFTQAEYVLYKHDGTELSEQEHRQAYQILLEQQWPTAPAFNSRYNPEIDEEAEIAKRLKAEVPTVYAQWIPKIVYELVMYKTFKWTDEELRDFSEEFSYVHADDSQIVQFGKDVNTFPYFIALHKKANQCLQIALNAVSLDNEDGALIRYYYKIMTGKSIGETMFSIANEGVINEVNHISFKILLLEERFKSKPNMFLLFRAGSFLPDRDFSLLRLQNFENDLSTANINKFQKIRSDYLHNISYGLSFFGAVYSHPGSSCFPYYFLDRPTSDQYGYALPLKKTDILNGTQLFGIPPLMTLIGSFFSYGELFHPRAFTLMTDDLQARQQIENGLNCLMNERYSNDKERLANIKGSSTWYDYWTTNPILSQLSFQLNSSQEVIRQAALRSRYIVENAIPLNDATQVLIDDARQIYK